MTGAKRHKLSLPAGRIRRAAFPNKGDNAVKRIVLTGLVLGLILCGCGERSLGPPVSPEPDSEASPAVPAQPVSLPPEESSSPQEPVEEDWRLMLVNPDHLLPDDFTVELAMTSYGYEMDARIVEPLTAMIEAAAADGVTLLPCYGYRTREQSAQLFEKQVSRQLAAGLSQEAAVEEAKKWVAPPGTSDHHTGLALDIVTPEHQVLNHAFAGTPAARWMAGHSTEYGFVIRFPEDKQEITGITYEPWHLRYVGEEHARVMREQNLCLEEYWEQLYGEGQA